MVLFGIAGNLPAHFVGQGLGPAILHRDECHCKQLSGGSKPQCH